MYLYTDYNKHNERKSELETILSELREQMKEYEKTKELILNMHKYGLSLEKIADIVKKDISEVQEIISNS